MRTTTKRTGSALAAAVVGAGLLAVPAAPASATGNCDPGSYKRVSKRVSYFSVVDKLVLDNRRGKATLSGAIEVGETRTSKVGYSASVSVSVEASFFSFAKASASTTYGVSLEKAITMSKTYKANYSVPKGKIGTLQWGFHKISQTIQQYHLSQRSTGCVKVVDKTITVSAPWAKGFRTV